MSRRHDLSTSFSFARALAVQSAGCLPRRLKSHALHRRPGDVPAQVLPGSLQSPKELKLPVGNLLKKTVNDQPRHVAPVVVPSVSDLFLQDRAHRNQGGKQIAEYQEFREKNVAQLPHHQGQKNRRVARDLDERSKKFEDPHVGQRNRAKESVTRPEQHVAVRPEDVNQSLLPSRTLSPQ